MGLVGRIYCAQRHPQASMRISKSLSSVIYTRPTLLGYVVFLIHSGIQKFKMANSHSMVLRRRPARTIQGSAAEHRTTFLSRCRDCCASLMVAGHRDIRFSRDMCAGRRGPVFVLRGASAKQFTPKYNSRSLEHLLYTKVAYITYNKGPIDTTFGIIIYLCGKQN